MPLDIDFVGLMFDAEGEKSIHSVETSTGYFVTNCPGPLKRYATALKFILKIWLVFYRNIIVVKFIPSLSDIWRNLVLCQNTATGPL